MTENIYQDIAKRTGGDIYIGVVGPVRTGKSTLIERILHETVVPGIENEYDRQRTMDSIPQSAAGRTVMTTEPKFIPDSSVAVTFAGGTTGNIKLIDCVGYLVDGALGTSENGAERMVKTPWSEEEIPFAKAAEIGTEKVIRDHATIGMLVTTDGSIGDIPRENYLPAEERVAKELTEIGKPFAIVLNSAHPEDEGSQTLAQQLEEKYGVPVALVNCLSLNSEDIREILGLVLGEFPLRELRFSYPEWLSALPTDHPLWQKIRTDVESFAGKVRKIGDIAKFAPTAEGILAGTVSAGDGVGEFEIPISVEDFYKTLSEWCGVDVKSEADLFRTVKDLAEAKRAYSRVEKALSDVSEKGYGVVLPSPEELEFEEPKLVKQAAGWGVKVSAKASSVHMIRADIRTELSPVVGSEEQSEEVVKYLTDEYEEDPKNLWRSNMFGKSLYDLVSDGVTAKLQKIGDDSREKLGNTLEKIINEGSNGLICILL